MGSGVGSTDADVVHSACDAQGDATGGVDAVVAHASVIVGVSSTCGRGSFRQGEVAGRGGRMVRQGSVRSAVVVFLGELVEQLLQLFQGRWLGVVGAQPVLHRLLKPLDLPLSLGVRGRAVLLHDVAISQFGFEGVAAASAPET